MEITPEELKAKLECGDKIALIDVREPNEHDICRLAEAKLIPMRKFSAAIGELDPKSFTVLYCHHGVRSAQAVLWLRQNGFENAWSLQGGIDAWAEAIDPSMERY